MEATEATGKPAGIDAIVSVFDRKITKLEARIADLTRERDELKTIRDDVLRRIGSRRQGAA
jgi:hypothetical protein